MFKSYYFFFPCKALMSHFVGSSLDNAMRRSYSIVGVGPGVIFSLSVLFALRQKERAFRLQPEQGWKIKIRAAAGKKIIEGTEHRCFKSEGSVPEHQR